MPNQSEESATLPADPGREIVAIPTEYATCLALAWKSYDHGQLDDAIRLAMEACVLVPGSANSQAALGWFLLEHGRHVEAESALLSAIACRPDFGVAYWYLGLLQRQQKRLDEAKNSLSLAIQLDPDLDEAPVALAWVLHDMGCIVDATIWARRALSLKAQPEREELLGWLLLFQKRFDEAVGLLQSALFCYPDRTLLRCHLATALHALQRGDEAIKLVQDGLMLSPNDPDLLLSLGWLHHGRGEVEPARFTAEQLVRQWPNLAAAWYLLGVIWHEGGNSDQAERCFAEVQARDDSLVDAQLRRAKILLKKNRSGDAVAILITALNKAKDNLQIQTVLAQGLIDLSRLDEARKLIHHLLRQSPRNAHLWQLLAQVLLKRKRRGIAKNMLRRACRLTPDALEIWRVTVWVALEDGDLALAYKSVQQLMKLAPDDPYNDIQAAFVLESCCDLTAASAHAESAVARLPDVAEAWRALAKVRYRQNRLNDAESLLQTAQALDSASADIDRQLGWVLMTQHRLEEAESAFEQAAAKDVENPTIWQEIAEVRRRAGRFPEALHSLQKVLRLHPDKADALLLKARILSDYGADEANDAVSLCSQLLRKRLEIHGTTLLLMHLAACGNELALAALRMVDRRARERLYGEALESAQGKRGNKLLGRLAAQAIADFPENMALATAAFFARGMDEIHSADDIARHARLWSRQFSLMVGGNPVARMPLRKKHVKLRIAYVAAHFHRSLLAPVLAAHDPGEVDVFLYTDAPREHLGNLGQHLAIHPLRGQNLAESMAANRIDVAVDTVGIHPFLGQLEVLKQFAMRIAPVQCAWLGSWAGSAGIFDVLIADQASLPPANESLYEEAIIRLPGGQWCWEPPLFSPDHSPPPFLRKGSLTLGSSVRSLRLTRRTQEIWGTLLARLPESSLELVGEYGQDWQFRKEFSEILATLGVDSRRVHYHPRRDYEEYLEFYRDIDIALDTFPSNGGLCLIDALWMGVPLVTRAGALLGERQGLSLLTSIGHPEWAGHSDEEYVEIVLGLATNRSALVSMRQQLRQEILGSPLVEGTRVARALEQAYRQHRTDAQEVADAESPKERSRALARRQFSFWREKQMRLDFSSRNTPEDSVPDVSVVIVLFNQVGLSLLTLSALADQNGVSFETIIIDNASSDATEDLLERLDGACIERNARNIGFLLAANQGAARARGRHVLFLNSDAILHSGALHHAVRRLDTEADAGAVGGRIVLGNGELQEAGCIAYRDGSTAGYGRGLDPFSPMFYFERDVDFCSGAFLMVRQSLWQQLGGFDSAYAPAYYEDTDFCLRVWDAGYRVVYEPHAWISHLEWGSATSSDEVLGLMERNREYFSRIHRDRLSSRPLSAYARRENDRWLTRKSQRVLVIDNAVPHMAIGGGLPRARSLLHALREHAVTFYPLWTVDEKWSEVYASIPGCIEVMLGYGANALEGFLEERAGVYDVILVSRPPNMAFIDILWERRPELFRGMRLIYDAEAVFALREIGQASIGARPLPRMEASRRLAAELALARRASTVLAVSKREAACFSRAGVGDVCILMHSMATREHVPSWKNRQGLLFVGALQPDTPNEDGLLWFAREVLPILRARFTDMPIIDIVGDCRSDKIAALAGEEIRLIGRVDDLTPYYDQARVFFAPARFAAGVPAKIIEAACNGIPVVASHLLVHQLGWRPEIEIISARDAHSFADALVRLYCDEALWTTIQNGSRCRTRAEAEPEKFERILREVLAGSGHRSGS